MTVRQRAIQAEAKQERYHAILDAALRLLTNAPDRLASMAEVAEEAGLAKGTVYLYFPSKEELFLALHERNVAGFFDDVIAKAEAPQPLAMDDMMALIRRHMLEPQLFLPLAARCSSGMAQGVSASARRAFMERMTARLARAGAGLERQFPQLPRGGGVALLRHSYALVLGLWQMSAGACPAEAATSPALGDVGYREDLGRAFRALWRGTIETEGASTIHDEGVSSPGGRGPRTGRGAVE